MDLFGPTGKVSKISVNHFSRLERPDRKGLFHLTIPTYSQSQYLAVRYFPCETWKKTIIIVALWIVNNGSISFTRTSMYSYNRSAVESQVYVFTVNGF